MRQRRLLLSTIALLTLVLGLLRDVVMDEDALRVHVVCPEHGELVHAAASARKHAEIAAAPDAAGHLDCALADMGPVPLGLPEVPPAVEPQPVLPLLSTRAAPRAPPASLSPLTNAPKTSPPV